MWSRATESTISDKSIVSKNVAGKNLEKLYRRFFSTFKASPHNAEALKSLWCPPLIYRNNLLDKLKRDIAGLDNEIFSSQLIDIPGELPDDPMEILEKFAHDIMTSAINTREPKHDSNLLIYGEPGSGKTTILNTVFTVFRETFKNNKIFWMRIGVVDEVKEPIKLESLRESFYAKFYKLILDDTSAGYITELNLQTVATINKIFPFEFNAINSSGLKKDSIFTKLRIYFRNNHQDFFDRMCQYMSNNGYSLVFLIDNIDGIESEPNGYTRDQIESYIQECLGIAFTQAYIKQPSLRILVARGDTVKRFCDPFKKSRRLSQYNIRHIGIADPFCIFERRLSFIKNTFDNSKQKTYLKNDSGDIPNPEKLINIYNNYLKIDEQINYKGENPIVELSNYNMTKMFNMALDVVNTHILDLQQDVDVNKSPDLFLTELKNHHLLWALLLRNRRLFYKNDPAKTWIYNIYDNNNNISTNKICSLWIKRLILDYFYVRKNETGQDVVSIYKFKEIFLDGFRFHENDLDESLKDLVENDLIYKFIDRSSDHYHLTCRGNYIRRCVLEKYIYLELVCEDTPVPEDKVKQLALFEYDPFEKFNYFKKKIACVRTFSNLLEDQENKEKERRNKGIQYCTKSYFPQMRKSLISQEMGIAKAFGQDGKAAVESCEVKWNTE